MSRPTPQSPADIHPEPSFAGPSPRLLSFALAGLLGVAACSEDDAPVDHGRPGAGGAAEAPSAGGAPSSTGDAGAGGSATDAAPSEPETYVVVLSSGPPITYAEMEETCELRGGFMQTHAACGGSNLCRGLSYVGGDDGGTLTEHSCKGMNSCRGFSCIDLPDDTGLTGEELFVDGPCGGCHDGREEGAADPVYTVFVPEGMTDAEGVDRFVESSTGRLETIVAFGTQGTNRNGSSFSNMPAYREQYSRAEITRVVEYLRGLRYDVYRYTTQGQDGGGAPAGHHPDPGVDGGPPDARTGDATPDGGARDR